MLEDLCAERQNILKIVKVDAGEHASVADGIHTVPMFRLYHHGEKIGEMKGYQSKAQFVRWVDAAVERVA